MAVDHGEHRQASAVVDLFTTAQPSRLACALVYAKHTRTQLLLCDGDIARLTNFIDGLIYESSGDFWYETQTLAQRGIADAEKSSTEISLADGRSSLLLVRAGIERNLIKLVHRDAWVTGFQYFVPPTYEIPGGCNHTISIHEPVPPEIREHQMAAFFKVQQLRADLPWPSLFPAVHPAYASSHMCDSWISALGAAVEHEAGFLTANRSWYSWLRKERFQCFNERRLRRTTRFADAIAVEPQHTRVADVLHVLDEYE